MTQQQRDPVQRDPALRRWYNIETALGERLGFFVSHRSEGRILVQVTIYLRLLIGRDGHLDKSEA